MFTITFPYDIGTFVRIKSKDLELNGDDCVGTISYYQCVDDDEDDPDGQFIAMVSGYKESWCGEYLMRELEILTEEEIKKVEKNKEIMINAELGFFKIFDKVVEINANTSSKSDMEDYALCLNSPWSIDNETWEIKVVYDELKFKCTYTVVGYDGITSVLIGYGNTQNEALVDCLDKFDKIQKEYNPNDESF